MARTYRKRLHFQKATVKGTGNKIKDRDVLHHWRVTGRVLGDAVAYERDCGGMDPSRARRVVDRNIVRNELAELKAGE